MAENSWISETYHSRVEEKNALFQLKIDRIWPGFRRSVDETSILILTRGFPHETLMHYGYIYSKYGHCDDVVSKSQRSLGPKQLTSFCGFASCDRPTMTSSCWRFRLTVLTYKTVTYRCGMRLLYRVYQKEVNSLKNDSKLKSMNYSAKILF